MQRFNFSQVVLKQEPIVANEVNRMSVSMADEIQFIAVFINPSRLGNVTLYLCSGRGDCMQLNPDILLSLSGLLVSQPLSQSVGFFFLSIYIYIFHTDF